MSIETCLSKKFFPTRKLAKEARSKICGIKLQIYKCPDCIGYHFTKKEDDDLGKMGFLRYKKA